MRFILILLFSLLLNAQIISPYESLSDTEKLEILSNHFINEQLQSKVPPKPIKGELEKSELINAYDYELYYNYIQRLKREKENRIDEQAKIDLKFEADIELYNNQVNKLKKYYKVQENLDPIINDSINKALKIVFGKPLIKSLNINKNNQSINAVLYIEDIYGFNKLEEKPITINIPSNYIEQFYFDYRAAKVFIDLYYDQGVLSLSGVTILFDDMKFKAIINDKPVSFKIDFLVDWEIFNNLSLEEENKKYRVKTLQNINKNQQ